MPTSTTPPDLRLYAATLRKRLALVVALALGVALAFALDLVTGPSSLGASEVLRSLFDPEALPATQQFIVREVRLPAAIAALLVGASLSLAGAEMQTILNNPLASPFTLGVSAAATLGAALAIALGITLPGVPPHWIVSANAFLFALASVFLLQSLARLRGSGAQDLVLFGIALVFAFNALVGLIQYISSEQALQQLVFWSLGSLGGADWSGVRVLGVAMLLTLPFSWRARWRMTALRMGDERARSFGVEVGRLRFAALLRVSLLAATSVALAGTIGFIGLVGPHLARLLVGDDHRFLLPASALAGALVLSLASTASKALVPGAVVPLGIVTSLIGVPAFLALVIGRRERL
ncbi:FecCD family ABC transporter permease [Gaopeijia maritima]|uniref:Iron ABC transporter permease n=1 Tax=Gaopeijia maritima TaxID=3119007 RepID=A0ABU9EC30_9BACT